MKNYNKILEAVNRGIQLALDDFDDDIQVQHVKSKQTNNLDIIVELLNHIYKKIYNNPKSISKDDYDTILRWYKSTNLKYQVKDKAELQQIISHIVYEIEPCANLNWLDVSEITNMNGLFRDMPFNGDISDWDVSQVKDMSNMFDHCVQFTGINTNLSNWDVSKVENMDGMFYTCSFNGIHNDLDNWDVSSVKDMQKMFAYSPFNGDISKWDVSRVKYMNSMFQYSTFNQPIGNWDISEIRSSSYMFFHAFNFDQDLSKWNANALSTDTFKYSDINPENLPKGKHWILK